MESHSLPPPHFEMNKDAATFLETLINDISEYSVTDEDRKKIHFQGLPQLIYEKLTTGKFRTKPITPKISNRIREAVLLALNENLPITITVPFGGYKSPRLSFSPHIDWAEVFTCILLRSYLAPVAALHKHGVILEYYSDEIIVNSMNCIPQTDLDIYNNEFASFLRKFQRYLPPNLTFRMRSIREHISQQQLFEKFDLAKVNVSNWWNSLPKTEQDLQLEKAERNYYKSLENIPRANRIDVLKKSLFIHEAFVRSHWDTDILWAFGKGKIPIGFRYADAWGIQVRSSTSSAIQFWVGTGILSTREDSFQTEIIGFETYNKVQKDLRKIPLKIFPSSFKSLSTISLLSQ